MRHRSSPVSFEVGRLSYEESIAGIDYVEFYKDYEFYPRNVSVMADVSPGGYGWNPCSHTKITSRFVTPDELHHKWQINGMSDLSLIYDEPPGWPVGLWTLPDTSEDHDRFVQHFTHWVRDMFHSKVSVANFIYELKDFRKLAELAKELVSTKSHAISKQVDIIKKEVNDRGKQGIGGNYLEYKFNFGPLQDDCKALLAAFDKPFKRLKLLLQCSTYEDSKKWNQEILPGDPKFPQPIDWYCVPQQSQYGFHTYFKAKCVSCKVTHSAKAELSHTYELEGMHWWWAVADSLGLNNSIKVVWNALKMSWLVDFFIDSRKFIDAFHKNPVKGELCINRGCHSVKTICEWELIHYHTSDSGEVQTPCGQLQIESYHRVVTRFPDNYAYIAWAPALEDDEKLVLAGLADSTAGTSGRVYQTIIRRWKRMSKGAGKFNKTSSLPGTLASSSCGGDDAKPKPPPRKRPPWPKPPKPPRRGPKPRPPRKPRPPKRGRPRPPIWGK